MPRSRLAFTASPVLAVTLILALVLPAAAASPKETGDSSERACATILAAAPAGQDSIVVGSRCFATFAEAFEYGSGGAIQVPADLQADAVTQVLATAPASAPYILGTYWDEDNYSGVNWSWYASGGCTPTSGWQVSNVGTGLGSPDNRFDSSKSYSGCNTNRIWEHPNFGGVFIYCRPNCTYYGAMSNRDSSIRWWG